VTRILLVEDSANQREALERTLEQEGFEVEACTSAEAALEALPDQHFDLVLSDVNMPGMSGYDLCREIRKLPAYADLPFVILTALGEPRDILNGLACGADNFLTKPWERTALVERIRHVVANRRLRGERRIKLGIELVIQGQSFVVTSDNEQILDFLLPTYEGYRARADDTPGVEAEIRGQLARERPREMRVPDANEDTPLTHLDHLLTHSPCIWSCPR
jgi:DNA-binding response OmpR family regulator